MNHIGLVVKSNEVSLTNIASESLMQCIAIEADRIGEAKIPRNDCSNPRIIACHFTFILYNSKKAFSLLCRS